ncbi:hypothetical protein I79_015730 [Cricetulus griseus]|uniref:Uncharacterized protein n=1 Tax=Cricetulus griseus TaxID=10029 RepID=G3HXK6_CRIGR|nr:hypothetical protein I79_015730 [Cricetulus griseus]
MPMLFCCPLVAISTHSSITRFIKGSKPRSIPCTCLPPFNFTVRRKKEVSIKPSNCQPSITDREGKDRLLECETLTPYLYYLPNTRLIF